MSIYYPPKDELEKIERLATIGLNRGEIAAAIGFDRKWWYRQVDLGNAQLVEAYAKGVVKHATSILGSLYDLAVRDKNVKALMFLAKCNLKRRERSQTQIDARSQTINQGVVLSGTKQERLAQLQEMTIELKELIEMDTDEIQD